VLFTGKDFIIIDFEGEPGRTLAERRFKHSALRDVASMLRSLDYAALSALRTGSLRPTDAEQLEPFARAWSAWMGAAFVQSYLTSLGHGSTQSASSGLEQGHGRNGVSERDGSPEMGRKGGSHPPDGDSDKGHPERARAPAGAAPVALVPAHEEHISALLDFYLLDKCLYELDYEFNNRPDWVSIPLYGLLGLLEQNQIASEEVPSEVTKKATPIDQKPARSAP
jgi:maltose alpha-D-glucosyltransferase / alpha-amylase